MWKCLRNISTSIYVCANSLFPLVRDLPEREIKMRRRNRAIVIALGFWNAKPFIPKHDYHPIPVRLLIQVDIPRKWLVSYLVSARRNTEPTKIQKNYNINAT